MPACAWALDELAHDAVHPRADDQAVGVRLDVDVGCTQVDCACENRVDEVDRRRRRCVPDVRSHRFTRGTRLGVQTTSSIRRAKTRATAVLECIPVDHRHVVAGAESESKVVCCARFVGWSPRAGASRRREPDREGLVAAHERLGQTVDRFRLDLQRLEAQELESVLLRDRGGDLVARTQSRARRLSRRDGARCRAARRGRR